MSGQSFSLSYLGFDDFFARAAADLGVEAARVGRVVEEQRDAFLVRGESGEAWARLSGRFTFAVAAPHAKPAVGDFVVLRAAEAGIEHAWRLIDAVLPRRTSLLRQAAGAPVAAQLMAANVDTVLVATSANRDLNERRIERYVAAIWESGALPVVVVTKADLSDDPLRDLRRVAAAAPGVPAIAVSVLRGEGLAALAPYLKPGATLAVVGSSGVGKSTLVNWLLGSALQATQSIGDGLDKGRHTTTARSLFVLPGGALLIDTPGIREIAPWDAEHGTAATYADVEAVVAQCRFADCRHETEPDCAVKAALEQGRLDQGRLDGYAKMRREQAYQARKADKQLELEEKKRWKQIGKDVRARMREKGRK